MVAEVDRSAGLPVKSYRTAGETHAIAVPATGSHCAFMAALKQGLPRADFSIKSEG